ncbi:MAG: TIGR01459 family HAD-type hydrolase [Hyphomicrobiales bacterium]|nr:TIGR01459 family HAD-type hydrolase [Hyphomicrobiales bacterium]
MSETRILEHFRDAAPDYDVIFCDIWGVVHNGEHYFRDATDALANFRGQGGAVVLITNAPRPGGPIREQLDEMGVPRAAYDALITSGDVTVGLIAGMGSAPVHHIGPDRDLALYDEVARQTGRAPQRVPLAQADYVVCSGLFDDETETPDDYATTLGAMRARNLVMICANPDIIVHRGETLLYCAGALGEAYEQLGGEVRYAGKPHAPIYQAALGLARAAGAQQAAPRVLAVGDAIATDMRGAIRQKITGLLVTGGIHRDELHPAGGGPLNAARLDGFLAQHDETPHLAMTALRW